MIDFWKSRLEVNAHRAIFHQWEQLVASGCIENFRIAAGEVDGLREGWFFADSDAHKWLDAAARIYASRPDPKLAALMDEYVALMARAQTADGYLFTYNQIHFPGSRWVNLQFEHELYCHGHLIEAGVSHHVATGRADMLGIARRAANRIVDDFAGKGAAHTPGHEEIEIALLRLYQVTSHRPYLELARQFVEQRGKNSLFAFSVIKQNVSMERRGKFVQKKRAEYLAAHPGFKPFQVPPGNEAKQPSNTMRRWYVSALTGEYFQQHAPIRKQTIPVGHSVRFVYLETAIAMLARESADATLLASLEKAWEHMVTRRMYVTGGIGSLPGMEGFGKDYELDPEYAYAETCAALGCMFWNWEMARLTKEAKYSDLFEWQLYNAAAVGMSLEGTSYLYNNPLTCRGGVTRKPWYAVPCCPSNISRTWADLKKYACSSDQDEVYVHQYISDTFDIGPIKFEMRSGLPWDGQVEIDIKAVRSDAELALHLRLPSWSRSPKVQVNGQDIPVPSQTKDDLAKPASGYDPRTSRWLKVVRAWNPGDRISLSLDMPIVARSTRPEVINHQGKVAMTRGPLVYCVESVDHPGRDIFLEKMGNTAIAESFDSELLGGTMKLVAQSVADRKLVFVPYALWGNRGESTMTVWIAADRHESLGT